MQNQHQPLAAVGPQAAGAVAAAGQQAPGAPAANNPSFTAETAVGYLTRLASAGISPPSSQGLKCLAGTVASSMKPNNGNAVRPEVAFLFLKACAYQLPSLNNHQQQQQHQAHAAAAGGQHPAVVAAESDVTSKDVREIVEGIGNAVIRCSPRSLISESGILPIMAMLCCPNPSQAAQDITYLPYLTPVHAEFLQACIYAEQYRYAERCVASTWPRPTSSCTVKHVLRYYYLRGCVHLNCTNYERAIRCFNTCLVVPSEIVSSIAISAYKKLVLVQCLTLPATGAGIGNKNSSSSSMITLTGPLQLPKAAPPCLSRFLSQAFHATSTSGGGGGAPGLGQQQHPMANPEEHDEHYYSHEQQQHHHEAMLVVNDGPQQQGGGEEGEGGPSSAAGGAGGGDGQNPNNNNNNNNYQSLGVKPYADFVTAFTRLVDRTTINELVETHAALFSQDGNMGLIQQCMSDFVKRQVYHYSRIYSVLSLTDLSNFLLLPVPELRQLLMQLSLDKVWPIQIDDDDANGLVHFPRLVDLPPQQAGGGNGDQAPQVQQLMELTQLMQKLDLAVAASPKYVSVVKNTHNAKTQPPGADAAAAAIAAAAAAAEEIGPRGVEEI